MTRFVEDPDHVIDLDEADANALLRAQRAMEQMPVDSARRARLVEEESLAPELPPRRPRARFRWVLVLWVIGAPFAVLVRVCTMPWRRRIQHAIRARRDRARAAAIERAMRLAREASTADATALIESGHAWLAVGQVPHAEIAFDAALPTSMPSSVAHAVALQNRGLARARLGFPKLAARDIEESGRNAEPVRGTFRASLFTGFIMLRVGLVALAGFDDD